MSPPVFSTAECISPSANLWDPFKRREGSFPLFSEGQCFLASVRSPPQIPPADATTISAFTSKGACVDSITPEHPDTFHPDRPPIRWNRQALASGGCLAAGRSKYSRFERGSGGTWVKPIFTPPKLTLTILSMDSTGPILTC